MRKGKSLLPFIPILWLASNLTPSAWTIGKCIADNNAWHSRVDWCQLTSKVDKGYLNTWTWSSKELLLPQPTMNLWALAHTEIWQSSIYFRTTFPYIADKRFQNNLCDFLRLGRRDQKAKNPNLSAYWADIYPERQDWSKLLIDLVIICIIVWRLIKWKQVQ